MIPFQNAIMRARRPRSQARSRFDRKMEDASPQVNQCLGEEDAAWAEQERAAPAPDEDRAA